MVCYQSLHNFFSFLFALKHLTSYTCINSLALRVDLNNIISKLKRFEGFKILYLSILIEKSQSLFFKERLFSIKPYIYKHI